MIEVNLYLIPTTDANATVGRLVARSRYDKEAMGVSIMNFVKGFLKNNVSEFESSLKNPELINLINNDVELTVRDLACINYYLQRAGFTVQIQNVTDDEENANQIGDDQVEWNIIDYNFMQNDYPTAIKIIPEEGMDIPSVLKKIVDQAGLFDVTKFNGVKNPFTVLLANLERVKQINGSVSSSLTTRIYALLDQMGIKIFCATNAD
jgi:hypothetical protein